jgi:hypothetical protein
MLTIRLPKAEWAKAGRAMIEVGPVRLIENDQPKNTRWTYPTPPSRQRHLVAIEKESDGLLG